MSPTFATFDKIVPAKNDIIHVNDTHIKMYFDSHHFV